jgi:hypothetical protein
LISSAPEKVLPGQNDLFQRDSAGETGRGKSALKFRRKTHQRSSVEIVHVTQKVKTGFAKTTGFAGHAVT